MTTTLTTTMTNDSSFPATDPLAGLYWVASEVQRLVTPVPLTLAALLDPFGTARSPYGVHLQGQAVSSALPSALAQNATAVSSNATYFQDVGDVVAPSARQAMALAGLADSVVETTTNQWHAIAAASDYATQLRTMQGVLFGIAALVLVAAVGFAIGRIAFNRCGGYESTKEAGYKRATMWTTRVLFYVFGFVLL